MIGDANRLQSRQFRNRVEELLLGLVYRPLEV